MGLALLDSHGRVLHANQPACDQLGREENKLIGRCFPEFVHCDDRGWASAELELLLAGAIDRIRQEVRLDTAGSGEAWSELNVRLIGRAPDGSVYAVAILEDAGDRPIRERELRRLADTDPLTELLNRRRFAAELDRHLAGTARYGARGALLMLDIDGLKHINDTGGHVAGDQAIIATATLLRSHTRSSDVVARLGGGEFAVLLPAATREQAITVARMLLTGTCTHHTDTGPEPHTVSIGIATITDVTDAARLFQHADAALYEVKHSVGNGYAIEHDHRPATPPAPTGDRQPRLPEGTRQPHTVHDTTDGTTPEAGISLKTLLQTVAELGGASPGLIAWELDTDERAVTPAWSAAIREGLLERARYDPTDRDWQYELSNAGQEHLRGLEHNNPMTTENHNTQQADVGDSDYEHSADKHHHGALVPQHTSQL